MQEDTAHNASRTRAERRPGHGMVAGKPVIHFAVNPEYTEFTLSLYLTFAILR
jgi:hypothetical protein